MDPQAEKEIDKLRNRLHELANVAARVDWVEIQIAEMKAEQGKMKDRFFSIWMAIFTTIVSGWRSSRPSLALRRRRWSRSFASEAGTMPANSTSNAEAAISVGGMLIATVVANDEAIRWVDSHAGALLLAFLLGSWFAMLACLFVSAGTYRLAIARILAGGTIAAALTTVANLIGSTSEASFTLVVIVGGLAGGFLIKSGFLFAQELQDKGRFRAAFSGMLSFWWRKAFGTSVPPILPEETKAAELDTPVLPAGRASGLEIPHDERQPGNG